MEYKKCKKSFSKEELEKACKTSTNFTELQKNLGYNAKGGSRNTTKRLVKLLDLYKIDYSHFDRYLNVKLRRIHPIIEKECPVCKNKFTTEKGSKKEKTYCSYKCCNSLALGKRYSEESKSKLSKTLSGRTNWGRDETGQLNFEKQLFSKNKRVVIKNRSMYEKECEFCHGIFHTHQPKRLFCNKSCQMKGLWKRENYRNNIISQINEKVKAGKHKGWSSRNILSYPEKFFKKVLNLNGFKDRFIMNHPVKKSDLGIDCDACYFLDFYFPEFNLDLEIDGKQHKQGDRMESDNRRDIALDKNGYKIYRIEWKSINNQKGKDFIKKEIEKFLDFINNLIAGKCDDCTASS